MSSPLQLQFRLNSTVVTPDDAELADVVDNPFL